MELFVSWVPGLPSDREALGVLKTNPLITGVESCNVPDEQGLLNAAGLKLSMHNPAFPLREDLSYPGLAERIAGRDHLLDTIRASDAPTVGFHLCHSLLVHIRDVLEGKAAFRNRWTEAEDNIVLNLAELEGLINAPMKEKKKILFETNAAPSLARIDRLADAGVRTDVQKLMLVNSPQSINRVLRKTEKNPRIGFLFDVAHCLGASHNLAWNPSQRRKLMNDFVRLSEGRVFQVHLNRPRRLGMDGHTALLEGDALSGEVLSWAETVLARNPVQTVTLEVDTGEGPVAHARILAQQTELVRRRLKLA